MTMINPADISLRPATAGDEQFLKRVHHAARQWEFGFLLQSGEAELYHKIMEQQYGIGRIVMTGVCLEAAMRRKPVRLHVHYLSRALRFYQRLGFRQIGVEGPSYLMEWRHADAQPGRQAPLQSSVASEAAK